MLAQLLSDTGSPVATQAEINAGTALTIFAANTNLLNLIKDASNKILMACRVANRYLQSDLDKIYGDSDRNASIIRLTCDLVYGFLVSRRGLALQEIYSQAPMFKEALDTLAMLERGLRVLDDSPPDGTDAPKMGAKVEVNYTTPGQTTWVQQTDFRIFPQC
jgi:hypothetical protein